MRILHLTDYFSPGLGGIETHVAGLAAQQAAAGHEVTVSTPAPRVVDGKSHVDDGPVTVRRVRSALDGAGVETSTFDVVHAHVSAISTFAAPLAAAAARRGLPTIVTVHSLWGGLGPLPTIALDLATLRRAPVVWTAVSRVAAEQVAARLPPGRAVHVLPNAVSVDARAETPAEVEGMSVVSTMRLARRKRPLPLLDMFAALHASSDVPVRLTLVGDGAQRDAVERRARRLGLAEQVSVTGRVEPGHVLRLLGRSDVYVAPAVLESFGLAALEARCVGLPVVGRLGTGLADFVEHGVNGLLCDSDDAIVTALRRLAEHPELRRRMSEHNRTTGSEMTWAHTLERHDLVYDTARGTVREAAAVVLRTVTAG